MTENIIHLVLAKVPGSPEGTKGISMFIVPKVKINDDGSLGDNNNVSCISIEEKLGIHASPTCVMEYDGSTGYLVGEENRGLNYMFTMMNEARVWVGGQGLACASGALQGHLNMLAIEFKVDQLVCQKKTQRNQLLLIMQTLDEC